MTSPSSEFDVTAAGSCSPESDLRSNFSRIIPYITAQYIVFMLISQLIHRSLRCFHQTRFVSNMLAATVLGTITSRSYYMQSKLLYHGNRYVTEIRENIGHLGITFYIFLAAVKVDSHHTVSRLGKKAFKVGVPSTLLTMTTIVLCIAYIRKYMDKNLLPPMGGNFTASVYLAFGSSPNIVAALSELNLMSSKADRFAIATVVVNDMVLWAGKAILLSTDVYQLEIIIQLVVELLMVAFCIWVVRPYAKRIIMKRTQPPEPSVVIGFIIGAMVIQLCMGFIVGENLVGPILYGLVIPSGPPLGSTLVKKADLVVEEILIPFLYIEQGAYLSMINLKMFCVVGVVILAGFVVKFVVVMLCSRLCGFNSRDSRTIGLMLNFSGLVTVYQIDTLRDYQDINPLFPTSVLLSLVLLHAILSPLVKTLHQIDNQLYTVVVAGQGHNYYYNENPPQSIQKSRNDQEFRVITCVYDVSNISSISYLLDISNLTMKTRELCSVSAYVIHMAEFEGQTTPSFGPHFNHTRICHYNGCHQILSAFNHYTRFSKERVIVMPFTSISPYMTMHEEICRLAKDKNVPLIILPYNNKNNHQTLIGLRSIYIRMQRHALCTVGILIDKSQSSALHLINKSRLTHGHGISSTDYNVAIIFIGGPDDREALAYGLRMLGHQGLNLTLLHIQMTEMAYHDHDDMVLVEEFRIKSTDDINSNAEYHHIIVEGWDKAMEVMRHLVDHEYNLIIVGQRQGNSSILLQQEMMDWVEMPELGLVGDMLASAELNCGDTSVLVLHHHGHTHVEAGERSQDGFSKWSGSSILS